MGPLKETQSVRAARGPFQTVVILGLLMLLVSGCDPQASDDSDINALAATWPQYRAPYLDAPPDPNIWPRQTSRNRSPRATRAVPPEIDRPLPVITSYRYWNLEETAVDSLVRIGEPAVPELIKALRQGEPRVRYQAAHVLGRIGPEADDSVDALILSMDDPAPQVQKAAVRALGQIGPEASNAVRPLIDLINAAGEQRPSIPADPR